MTIKRWLPTFLGFPLGGWLAFGAIGSVEGPLSAAAGGLLARLAGERGGHRHRSRFPRLRRERRAAGHRPHRRHPARDAGPAGRDRGARMSAVTVAGLLLIAVPLAFNAAFSVLAARFDYPDVLRRPTPEVLSRFTAGGTPLVLTWWAFALSAVLLAPLVVLLSDAIDDADPALLAVATTVGVLAALVQFLGLIRWPFLVPYLARAVADPDASETRREAVD